MTSARRIDRWHLALVAVCILHALTPFVLRGLHPGYGWDETVYIRQIDPHVATGVFSAPRARGLTLLTAPAALVSSSETVMRLWLAAVAAAGLYLACLPWRRLAPRTIPVAAALWSGLWVTIYYSYEAMPNQYVAYGILAASGAALIVLRGSGRWRQWAVLLFTALAFTALVRPTDAIVAVAGLLLAAVCVPGVPRRRRVAAAGVMIVGVAAGATEWVIEAYARYGGLAARLHAASAQNTGGVHWALGKQFHALGGPLLCRGGCVAHSRPVTELWWFAAAALVVVGLGAARRRGALRSFMIPTVVAGLLAAEYLIGVDYAAPRFLEPTYALLALPAAEGLREIFRRLRPVSRSAGEPMPRSVRLVGCASVGMMVVALGLHEAVQLTVTRHVTVGASRLASSNRAVASYLRTDGFDRPCLVKGDLDGPVSFYAGCTDAGASTTQEFHRLVRAEPVAIIQAGRGRALHLIDQVRHPDRWQHTALPVPADGGRPWDLWLHLPADRQP